MATPTSVVPTSRESYNRRSRIWLKMTLTDTGWQNVIHNVKNILQKNTSEVASDLNSFVRQNLGGGVSFVIPLTGTIPVVTFKNAYDRMVQDLDFHTRAMADLMGAVGRTAGGAISALGKQSPVGAGEIQGFGNMVSKISRFVQAFGGNVMAPKVWRNGDVDDFRFGGRVGFENIHEWRYFKAVELIIQGILAPTKFDEVKKVSQLLNNLPILQNGVLDNLTLTLLQPNNVEVDIDVVVGTAQEMTSPTASPMILAEESFPLLALDRVYITAAEMNHGTDDGKGFDMNGVSRIADYTLEFTIKEFSSVTDGMKRQYEAMNFTTLETEYTLIAPPTVVDNANTLSFIALNTFLLAAIPGYLASQAIGIANLPSFLARKSLYSDARLTIG
jgi:hypothetical protein